MANPVTALRFKLFPGPAAAVDSKEHVYHRERLGLVFWISAVWMVGLATAAIFVEVLPVRDPTASDFTARYAKPGFEYFLGTDILARDIFSRIVHGARVSLRVGFSAPLIGMTMGLTLGLLAGYFRGKTETVITGTMDVILAFPNIVLAMAVMTFAGAQMSHLIAVLGVVITPAFTRVARANTLAFAEREFVLAARAVGASHARIIIRELLPNVFVPVVFYGLLLVSVIIMLEGVLAFLGVGVPPPTPTWGGMIAEALQEISEHPLPAFIPAAVMFMTILSLNLMGDRLRKFTDFRGSSL